MKITLTKADTEKDAYVLDLALKTARQPGDEVHLEPGGTYLTRGNWDFPGYLSLAAGVSLIGGLPGDVRPIVKLGTGVVTQTGGKERPSHDVNVLWAGANTSIRGVDFDAGGHDVPGLNCGGLRFFGQFSLSLSRITGLCGKLDEQEVFAVSSEGNTGGSHITGVTVEDCLVDAEDSYVSGIYLGATIHSDEESIVETCKVKLKGERRRGRFAYSSSLATRFVACYGEAERFWYTDTGPGIARIESCDGDLSYAVVSSVVNPGETQTRFVVVWDSHFLCPEGRGVEVWERGVAGIMEGGVIVEDSILDVKWRAAIEAPSRRSLVAFMGCTVTDEQSVTIPSASPLVV